MKNKSYGQTTEYNVYLGGGEPLGVATVELPNFESVSETLSGAGLGGEVEAAVTGLFKPMSCKLTFNKKTSNYAKLLTPVGHELDLRASVQGLNSESGAYEHDPERIALRTLPKKFTLGKFEVGKAQENEVEFEIVYVKLIVNGEEYLEFDKFNYIFVVDGTDYMSDIRRNIGMES
ncbi:MAG TPA: phage tail protein [Desulfovibrio sp.]|nr:phage tail protein [Desulfovibrio sp.]